jgi:hypothetical protein
MSRGTVLEPDKSNPGFSKADAWITPGRFALLLALLLLATFHAVLLGGQTFFFHDFGLFSYPVAAFHRQAFWKGQLPLWNPFSHCGVPFLAQWNTLTLYPPSLIYLLLPLSWSLPFFCLLHLFWSGIGMYFLAQRWTQHRLAAALAGIIFCFNGLSLNFLMWPSHIATFAWLPWMLWLAPKAWRAGGRKILWATAACTFQMLAGGPETILFSWLLLLLLAVAEAWRNKDSRWLLIGRFAGIASLTALLCSVQLLPFLQLLAHSQRDSSYATSAHNWSLPPWGWANFLVPLFRTNPTAQGVFMQNGQYWTSSYYAGIATIFLTIVAVCRVRDWRVRLLAVLCFIALVLAWGDTSLLYCVLRSCFPGLGFVRYPVKFVILVLALMPLLAAFGFKALAAQTQKLRPLELGIIVGLFLLTGMIIAIDSQAPPEIWRPTWHNGLSRAGFLLLTSLVTVWLLRAPASRRILAGGMLLLAFWGDLATHVPSQNPTVSPSVYAPNCAQSRLDWFPRPALGLSRVMVGPEARDNLSHNSLPNAADNFLRNRLTARADANLLDEIPQVDGFFSLVPREAYEITSLPYRQPQRDLPALLDFMAVSHATAPGTLSEWAARPTAMPWITAGQEPVFADDPQVLTAFSQAEFDPRLKVFLPPEARTRISASSQSNTIVLAGEVDNNHVTVQTQSSAPAMVVFSQSWYPAWKASIDGHPARLWRANYAFAALEVPAGKHSIRLVYEDRSLITGAVLSASGLLGCFGLWLRSRHQPFASSPSLPQ